MNLKERWYRSIKGVSLKGPLITSIYALLLSSLSLLGLVSLAAHFYMHDIRSCPDQSLLWVALHSLVGKTHGVECYIVMSVLEEKQGVIALGVSAYVSRGCRRRGLFLMLMFFVWRLTRYIFNCLISESLFKFEQTKISLLRESYALLFSGHTDLEHRSPCAFLGFPRNPQRSKTTP